MHEPDKMNKNEIVIAVKAYEAGYNQAIDDFAKALIHAHSKVFESSMVDAANAVEKKMAESKGAYFDALTKGKISL